MKPIPLALIMLGGIMIFAGTKKTNPLAVIKGVLTGDYTFGATTPAATSTTVPASASTTTPGGNAVPSGQGGIPRSSGLPTGSSTFGL